MVQMGGIKANFLIGNNASSNITYLMVGNIIVLWTSCLVDRVGLTGEGLIKDMDFELNLEG